MRLLLDKNLSYRLCAMLEEQGLDARHVDDLELGEADDEVILTAARVGTVRSSAAGGTLKRVCARVPTGHWHAGALQSPAADMD